MIIVHVKDKRKKILEYAIQGGSYTTVVNNGTAVVTERHWDAIAQQYGKGVSRHSFDVDAIEVDTVEIINNG
tara:strand:- start:660 stop:875 length:216 start_codon:yes stop_codon:yes gene_type:complete